MDFTVVDKNGLVLRNGSCQESDFNLQAGEEEIVLKGHYDENYYFTNGKFEKIPEKPTGCNYFNVSLGRWVYDEDTFLEKIRSKRNMLLIESDWTQTEDSPADKKSWAKYRQELRDLPSKIKDPENFSWPKKPE